MPEVSQAKAAEMLNVSERSVRNAKAVLDSGNSELIDAVKAGASLRKAAETVRRAVESVRPAPERPKPAPAAFERADVMVEMRMLAQRLSGASLAQLIAEWIMARVEVAVAVGSRADIMAQLGGGEAARSSISKWVRDDDVLDSQRAALAKEAIAAIKHDSERDKLIEELGGDHKPAPLHRERI